MKKILTTVLALTAAGFVFAQQAATAPATTPAATPAGATAGANTTPSLSEPDPTVIGNDSAKQALREVSVDKFELEGGWNAHISPDNGVLSARLFDGSPAAKEPLKDAQASDTPDTKVFGVKVDFFHRGINSIYIRAARPIAIEGVTKTISVWLAGRNMDHSIYLLVQDYFGNDFELYLGSLAFSGWKKLSVAIPPTPDGEHGIIQQSAYNGIRPGLRIVGFRIDCDPMLARGTYYVYFDDLRAVTDLYDLEHHDQDDMQDNW
jgi:hypothetical protein